MTRPEKKIDWDLVDQLLEAECTGIEIAEEFNMHPDTFYRKIQEKYSIGLTDYSSLKKARGDSRLKLRQYNKAVIDGDSQTLLWLAKVRLKQKEADSFVTLSEYDIARLSELIKSVPQVKDSVA